MRMSSIEGRCLQSYTLPGSVRGVHNDHGLDELLQVGTRSEGGSTERTRSDY